MKEEDPAVTALRQARRETELAKRRLDSSLGAFKYAVKPRTVMTGVWDGAKRKGGNLTHGAVSALKARPAVVGGVAAVLLLFLARRPVGAALAKIFSRRPRAAETEFVETSLKVEQEDYGLAAPVLEEPVREGVIA